MPSFNKYGKIVGHRGAAVMAPPDDIPAAGQQQAPAAGVPDEESKNNEDPNKFSWHNEDTDTPNNPDGQQPQGQQAPKDPQAQLQAHLEDLNLMPQDAFQSAMAKFQEDGNAEGMHKVMGDAVNNAYLQAINTMNGVMAGKIEQAVQQAVSTATGQVSFSQTLDKLTSELPFVKNAEIQPIATAALKSALKTSKSPDQAIARVKNLMKQMYDGSADVFGSSSNQPGSGGFNGNAPAAAQDNWDDVFAGKG